MNITKTWDELKALITAKSLKLQYELVKNKDYHIWVSENGTTYEMWMLKESPTPDPSDQKDFEDNYKDDCNAPIEMKTMDDVPYVRVTDRTVGLVMHIHGSEFTAAADTVTKDQMKFTQDIEIVGATMSCAGSHNGDVINMKVIDIDNVLGYGAGVVLAQFAIDVPGELMEGKLVEAISTSSSTIPAGVYCSMEYTNTHASEEVDVHYIYKYYK